MDLLTQNVEREVDSCQAEALKEAQRAEHGDVDGESHGQTKHQHEQHWHDQHRVSAKPAELHKNSDVRKLDFILHISPQRLGANILPVC